MIKVSVETDIVVKLCGHTVGLATACERVHARIWKEVGRAEKTQGQKDTLRGRR